MRDGATPHVAVRIQQREMDVASASAALRRARMNEYNLHVINTSNVHVTKQSFPPVPPALAYPCSPLRGHIYHPMSICPPGDCPSVPTEARPSGHARLRLAAGNHVLPSGPNQTRE